MLPWLKAQSQIPSTMWLRSSGKMDMTTPNGTPSAMLINFYGVSQDRTKRTTQRKYNKKLFLSVYFASSFPQNQQNFAKQWENSLAAPTSG